MMTLHEAIEAGARGLQTARERCLESDGDAALEVRNGRRLVTIGTLHLYVFASPAPVALEADTPVSLLLPGVEEASEGLVLAAGAGSLIIQTDGSLGDAPGAVTLVPDRSGHLATATERLREMGRRPEAYHPATVERLLPLIAADHAGGHQVESAAFSAIWESDPSTRRSRLFGQIAELVRANKRALLLCPTHAAADALTAALARQLKLLALPFASLLTRYEIEVPQADGNSPIRELGFEAQMHRFFARARADKAALRGKYERFKELTPILAYKAEKQKDLNEVKLLEWRLLSQLSDLQGKLKEVRSTLEAYEAIPVWKRLAMQTMGKNPGTLPAYATLYEQQIKTVMGEVDIAQQRIAELTPEAAIPQEMRPEYEELKEEIRRVGGTKKIRELIAAEEGTNRQAFLQNKRIVIATPARVATDPLFEKVRFDVLIADDAPLIPGPFLLAAAGLARERVLICGSPQQREGMPSWQLASRGEGTPQLTAAR